MTKTQFISLLIFAFPFFVQGQRAIAPTNALTISGQVKAERTISLKDLSKYGQHDIGDFEVTNHMGELKSVEHGLRGVLLKDVLSETALNANKPNELRAYYFVLRASDGYIVVYS